MGGFVAPCPSGLGPEPWSCSSPAVARNVSARRLDLMSAAERGRPALPRYRTPFSYTRELWDVQRFKERPPRPGFVICPPRWEVQPTNTFAHLARDESSDVSLRIENTT